MLTLPAVERGSAGLTDLKNGFAAVRTGFTAAVVNGAGQLETPGATIAMDVVADTTAAGGNGCFKR